MPATSAISENDVQTFRTEGVLKVDFVNLVGPELYQGMLRACAEAERKWPRKEGATRIGGGDLRFEYPEFDAVARSPRLGEAAARLAGAEHMRIWLDAVEALFPGFPGTSVHQDLPNYPFDRRGLLTVIVALEDVTVEMGVNQFLPRSHRLGPLGSRPAYDPSRSREFPVRPAQEFMQLLRADDREVVGEVICETQRAGEAVIHDGLVLHGSGLNTGDRAYRRASFVFFPADTKYTCVPWPGTEGLGLQPFKPLDHPRFAIVA